MVAKEAEDVLFFFLHGIPGRRNCVAELPAWVGMDGHRLLPATGSRDWAMGWASSEPLPLAMHAAGLIAQLAWYSFTTVRITHSCILPLIQALWWLQDLNEHTGIPVQPWGGRGDGSQSGSWTVIWTSLGARKRLWLACHAAAQTRTVVSSSQEPPVTSVAALAPMYQSMKGWHVLWKQLPIPVLSPPSHHDAKHTLWQADDSMTQTYIQRGLRHVRCSLSTSLTL